jgi:hypothetical protein
MVAAFAFRTRGVVRPAALQNIPVKVKPLAGLVLALNPMW